MGMNPLLLVAFLQAVLEIAIKNVGDHRKEQAVAYLGLLSQLIQQEVEVNTALQTLTDKVREGAPSLTPDDFEDLKKRSAAAHAIIQGAPVPEEAKG